MGLFANIIKRLNLDFKSAVHLGDEELVIYAGPDENLARNSFDFGIYCWSGGGYVWLPASATDDSLIAQLQKMQVGQSFVISAEETQGGWGTWVKEIIVKSKYPIVDVSNAVDGTLHLNNP